MDFLATWQRWCPSPSLSACRLAERAINGTYVDASHYFAAYRALPIVGVNMAVRGATRAEELRVLAEVRLLMAVALAVGEA